MAKKRRIKKKKKSSGRLAYFLIGGLIVFSSSLFIMSKITAQSDNSEINNVSVKEDSVKWWDENYAYRRKIQDSIDAGSVEINHSELVVSGKSNNDGSDLLLVYQSGDEGGVIESNIIDSDSFQTKIVPKVPLAKFEDIYLYYGNKVMRKVEEESVAGISTSSSDTQSGSTLTGSEELPLLQLKSLRKWHVQEKGLPLIFNYLNSGGKEIKNVDVYINGELFKSDYSITDGLLSIPAVDIKIGEVTLFIYSRELRLRSNSVKFYLSAPVYITWTIDWEGVDPTQRFMDMMGKVADEYKVPMTHFFNPRILINVKIDEYRKKEITKWVKNRLDKNKEDLALHMHMQHDLVEEAGVKAKLEAPSWDGGYSGYDVPSTNYDYEEFLKIVKWGKQKLIDAGFPEPIGYRTGGWFADMDNLKAIQDAGFFYDSSSRVSFAIGKNGLVQAWDLSQTSQPYYPNTNDQSSSEAPNMKLLEIPNNGSDSYWSTADQMIENFYLNYAPGSIIETPVIVTYLTHPEWFDIDDPKLRILFETLQDFSYDMDGGPVRFVTIKEYLQQVGKV